MKAIKQVEGRAYPFGRKNVDTDLIIPAAWLKTVTREGLGKGAFEALRSEPGNVFDNPDFAGAPIIVAGDNFGCGSSREHAAWALLDMGVQAVIAPSFSATTCSCSSGFSCTKPFMLMPSALKPAAPPR